MRGKWACAAALALLLGCASVNLARLDDTVTLFHDDLRWGRLPAAELSVADELRARFVRGHAVWGSSIRIVDLEVEGARIRGSSGIVRAHYLWTRGTEVDTRETVVETHWRGRFDGTWVCDGERIVEGDSSLLAAR
jgi:hypothetical protein